MRPGVQADIGAHTKRSGRVGELVFSGFSFGIVCRRLKRNPGGGTPGFRRGPITLGGICDRPHSIEHQGVATSSEFMISEAALRFALRIRSAASPEEPRSPLDQTTSEFALFESGHKGRPVRRPSCAKAAMLVVQAPISLYRRRRSTYPASAAASSHCSPTGIGLFPTASPPRYIAPNFTRGREAGRHGNQRRSLSQSARAADHRNG